jgi:hypothetical protein
LWTSFSRFWVWDFFLNLGISCALDWEVLYQLRAYYDSNFYMQNTIFVLVAHPSLFSWLRHWLLDVGMKRIRSLDCMLCFSMRIVSGVFVW